MEDFFLLCFISEEYMYVYNVYVVSIWYVCLTKIAAVFQFRWHILATQKCRVPAPSEQAQNWQGTIVRPVLFLVESDVETPGHPFIKRKVFTERGLHQIVEYVDFLLKSVWLFAMILTEAEKYHTLTASPYPACAANGPSESSWHAWHVTRDFYQPHWWKISYVGVLCSCPLNRQVA